ncbi:MFS transporter, partial [Pseudoalteromonas sp. S4488]
ACMTFPATTEFGTQQWIERILGSSGASPMVVLAENTGLKAEARFCAGRSVLKHNPTGVLLGTAISPKVGIYM